MPSISSPVGLSIPPEDNSCAIEVLAAALDQRDSYTDIHCDRVSQLALALGKRCDLSEDRLGHLVLAARFHDVGKIGIRDDVLLHPGRLDEEKCRAMRTHPERGARLFRATGREDADHVARLIRHHHEAFDGSGYPDGLKGGDIPLEARILTIADGYDAMTSARPYRGPMPHSRAMGILTEEQGRLIDPDVFHEFTRIIQAGALEEV
ncbi:HD family phosphohydrolase [Stenotrophomonas pictorum JCM 9942]|jgi:HD-GYP domain-containing protein (c-di-GMP phosphodiesterase class II)|uniref:HD family phosphohydrolase n=1 Tax=Stenotrophomonas pictorum JCM 9942 TaxID=1236960 RepID=A0A0R0ADV3_9GAMM|nr:HD domain-containing phosphohydrolase [Stenotrophomonas pictorum]KRG39687.1 HD family phosphohydrolase [Stenotrophomonas pictorum JCM 9942]